MTSIDCSYSIKGSGPAVFFVHGIGARKTAWNKVCKYLEKDFTCICYDLRGHGDSPKGTLPFSLESLVDDVELLRQKLNIQKIHIINKVNGTVINIITSKLFPRDVLAASITQGGWLNVTIAGALLDSLNLAESPLNDPVIRIRTVQSKESAQLSFLLKSKVDDFDIETQKNSINIFLRMSMSKNANKIREMRNRWLLNAIVIDAGHGGKDTGAIGVGGLQEKTVTLDIASYQKDGNTPIKRASFNRSRLKNDIIMVIHDWIINGLVAFYKKEYPQGTAFVVACEKGNLEGVKSFIAHDTEVLNQVGKASNGGEYTGLGVAAVCGRTEVVNIMLEKGAIIHQVTLDGGTPLLKAATKGHTEVVKFLLEKGAEVYYI